jgi:hypothetical protein
VTKFAALGALVLSASFGAAVPGAAAPESTPRPSPAADAPCGFVEFIPAGRSRYVEGTALETIKATVSFTDGHRESAVFPYSWRYPNGEKTDPWSDTNLRRPDFAVTLQLPPPGADVNAFPPLIQYILKHTGPEGYTDLQECGRTGPRATAVPTSAADVAREVNAMRVKAEMTGPMWLTFVDVTPADSPIKIVDATMYTLDRAFDASFVRECVTFWNRSPQTVTAIRFAFTYFDAAGKVKYFEPFFRLGSFAPGVVVEGVRRGNAIKGTNDLQPQSNCRKFGWLGDAAVNRVAVTAVEFAGGATWPAGSPFPWPAPQR